MEKSENVPSFALWRSSTANLTGLKGEDFDLLGTDEGTGGVVARCLQGGQAHGASGRLGEVLERVGARRIAKLQRLGFSAWHNAKGDVLLRRWC